MLEGSPAWLQTLGYHKNPGPTCLRASASRELLASPHPAGVHRSCGFPIGCLRAVAPTRTTICHRERHYATTHDMCSWCMHHLHMAMAQMSKYAATGRSLLNRCAAAPACPPGVAIPEMGNRHQCCCRACAFMCLPCADQAALLQGGSLTGCPKRCRLERGTLRD